MSVATLSVRHLWLGVYAITWREIAKFLRQTERLISALIRPSLWLLVFATGLHDLLGVSIVEPYQTYTLYQEYILPGLIGIIVLFQCMQSALSMVYDREAGVMRVMLVTPLPRGYLLFAGGLDIAPYLGSRATFTLGGFGGQLLQHLQLSLPLLQQPSGASRQH